MIIPWQVDVPMERWPVVNWMIVVLCVLMFAWSSLLIYGQDTLVYQMVNSAPNVTQSFDNDAQSGTKLDKAKEIEYYYGPLAPMIFCLYGFTLKGLLGHMWLHGGLFHIVGNMLFLLVFGNAVCAKIGNFRYLGMYILCGVAAALIQLIFGGGPMIGASGAIFGIVGMFFMLFPQNEITCYFFWPFPLILKRFTVSSIWMIIYWICFNLFFAVAGIDSSVAYFAHIGGFAAGAGIGYMFLKLRWVEMEKYELSLLQWIDQAKRILPRENIELAAQRHNALTIKPRTFSKPAPFKEIAFEEPMSFEDLRNISVSKQKAEAFASNRKKPPVPEGLIRFNCSCGKKLKMQLKYAGMTSKCPHCGTSSKIPDITI
jgi:membrane associated rhomboid family serine protease